MGAVRFVTAIIAMTNLKSRITNLAQWMTIKEISCKEIVVFLQAFILIAADRMYLETGEREK